MVSRWKFEELRTVEAGGQYLVLLRIDVAVELLPGEGCFYHTPVAGARHVRGVRVHTRGEAAAGAIGWIWAQGFACGRRAPLSTFSSAGTHLILYPPLGMFHEP